jgi:glycosyltransferase involved in cell wall biosynthesis
VGSDLDAVYDGADVLVSASRAETYGMVVTEALARGLPVIATRTGGVPEALGRADGGRPGLLVPPGDSRALAAALRRWLGDSGQRERLRKAAQARRLTLSDWPHTSLRLSRVLTEVAR